MRPTILMILLLVASIAVANDSWGEREKEVIKELNLAFDKFKLKDQKLKFEKNQKSWNEFFKKNCEELTPFEGGSAYSSVIQDCWDRAIKYRIQELRAVYFQTWPSSVNDKIDKWLK